MHINRLKSIPLILGIVGCEALAQSNLKEAHINPDNKITHICTAMFFYALVCILLFFTYDYMQFSLVNSTWSVMSIMAITFIGIFRFHETFPLHDKIAWILMVSGLCIVYFMNGDDTIKHSN